MMYIANDTPPEISHSDWLLETSPLVHNITCKSPHGKYGAIVIAIKVRVDQAIRLKTCYSQQNIIINNWKLLNKTLTHAIVYGLMVDYNQKHKNMVDENYSILAV